MGYIVLAIFLGLIAVTCIVGGILVKDRRTDEQKNSYHSTDDTPYGAIRASLIGVGSLFLVGLVLLFALGGEVSVPVNTTGVPIAFGAVSGSEMGPGVHWTFKPWLSVTDIDETVQTLNLTGKNCLTIRIGGQQTACANVRIRYQIESQAADSLFKEYANQGNLMTTVQNSVVLMELENVTNQVLGDYNPITDVQSVANTNSTQSLFTTFGPTILADMQKDIGSQVKVISLTLPSLQYSSAVESKLQAIQQSYADYAIAQENVQVAQEQSKAYVNLGDPTMNQLVAQCLTEAKTNTNLQCIPGATSNLSIAGK